MVYVCSEGIYSLATAGCRFHIELVEVGDRSCVCCAIASVAFVLVPGGGLGLCSEGIYSLATASCRFDIELVKELEALGHVSVGRSLPLPLS